ncbi:MAG: sugar ABC transporter permease, partial [Armatimonadetes bacterium]|nr:sugar ABC transporter permease [Armatimonadota bacterium]
MTGKEKRAMRTGLAFVSPWIIGFAIFMVYPILASVYYSFCEYSVLDKARWIGTANYVDLIHDKLFWKSLSNTLFFSILSVPIGLAVA